MHSDLQLIPFGSETNIFMGQTYFLIEENKREREKKSVQRKSATTVHIIQGLYKLKGFIYMVVSGFT